MFCTRCGLKVVEGNRFCQSCGQEVGVAAPGAMNVPQLPAGMNSEILAPLPYAGFWLRFVGSFIDGLILAIPVWLIMISLFFLFGGFALVRRMGVVNDPHTALAFAGPLFLGLLFGLLLFVALQWLYFAGMESSERQATFGKAAMSLRVTNLEGRRLSFGHATGRFFAKLVAGLIPFGIGYIMAGFTEKKQALHDMIAGTLVLRK